MFFLPVVRQHQLRFPHRRVQRSARPAQLVHTFPVTAVQQATISFLIVVCRGGESLYDNVHLEAMRKVGPKDQISMVAAMHEAGIMFDVLFVFVRKFLCAHAQSY